MAVAKLRNVLDTSNNNITFAKVLFSPLAWHKIHHHSMFIVCAKHVKIKVSGPWKATVTNKQFLLVHLLDK